MTLRRAAVAGTWYPASAAVLARQLDDYLESAERDSTHTPPPHADIVALIAPHAGLMYSGPVAACAYQLLQSRQYESIVLVGPSHYVAFEGVAIATDDEFETPLGPLPVDASLRDAMRSACQLIVDRRDAHLREHSLEMQLPFIARLVPSMPIVPLVMGLQTRGTSVALGEALADVCRGRRVLLVASSDLSHFHDAETAARLDHEVIAQVDRLDDDGLMALLERRAEHACGGGPMVAVLRAARHLGAHTSRVLRYADSGDVSGDKSSVVGYLASAAWR